MKQSKAHLWQPNKVGLCPSCGSTLGKRSGPALCCSQSPQIRSRVQPQPVMETSG